MAGCPLPPQTDPGRTSTTDSHPDSPSGVCVCVCVGGGGGGGNI